MATDTRDTWELDILGIPFGDYAHRDADGEYFDADTELHADKFGLPPLVHYHGYGDDKKHLPEPEYVGRTIRRWVDKAGVWFRAVLNQDSIRAAALWVAARRGTVRASSGSVAHLVRTAPDGHIKEWPVAELSIFDMATGKNPANRLAVVRPGAKAASVRIGLPRGAEASPVTPRAVMAADKYLVAQARQKAIEVLLRED